jgi:hypothetical protein
MEERSAIPDGKRRRWLVGAAIGLLLGGLAAAVLFRSQAGVRVIVQSSGSQALRGVVLHVTGASYVLGDIPPVSSCEVTVHPTGESHLEISCTDAAGQTQQLDAGGYFEPGYRGTIRVSIKDGVLEGNEQDLRLR